MSILVELSNTVQKQVEKEYEYSAVHEVVEDIMYIVGRDEEKAIIVLEDLQNGLTVQGAEKEIKKWADRHRKGNSSYCPKKIARDIICEYFGLPKLGETVQRSQPKPKAKSKTINLADFL